VGPDGASCASAPVHVHRIRVVCVRISGKGKRGRVFVRFTKCTTGKRNGKEGDEELEGREIG